MPTVSAACGFSPTERTRSPNGVRNSTQLVPATTANMAKKIGLFSKSCEPMIGMSESRGIDRVPVGTPADTPVSTMTSERRKPVRPSASRLITTPEMIWSTRKVTDSRAWSKPMRPPVARATSTAAQSAQVVLASPRSA